MKQKYVCHKSKIFTELKMTVIDQHSQTYGYENQKKFNYIYLKTWKRILPWLLSCSSFISFMITSKKFKFHRSRAAMIRFFSFAWKKKKGCFATQKRNSKMFLGLKHQEKKMGSVVIKTFTRQGVNPIKNATKRQSLKEKYVVDIDKKALYSCLCKL